jgi:hypothetical protein
LNELLCDHPNPGEVRLFLGFVGAGNGELEITLWSDRNSRR